MGVETFIVFINALSWFVALNIGVFMFWRWIIPHEYLGWIIPNDYLSVLATAITVSIILSVGINVLEAYKRKVNHGQ